MAITKVGHMKQSNGSNPAQHLLNSIKYIMNPEKTEHGLWTGSNCGTSPEEIYRSMLDTKERFGKEWGRQGYHFVISFPPGETDEKTAYEFAKKFCERFLGKNYEYCFAVHNDQVHMHIHFVFNSVEQVTGYKYRYVDGDWEKRIQPVTDKLCEEFGLSILEYDKKKQVGKSYREHMAKKNGKIVWTDIIRADIDAAAARSYSREEFFNEMEAMGYRYRIGHARDYGEYVAYHAPGADRARRDYRLGPGYSISDIDKKISSDFEPNRLYDSRFSKVKTDNTYQQYIALRIRQATAYYIFKNDEIDQARVRKDLLHINQLEEECDYLLAHPIQSADELNERLQRISQELKAEKNRLGSNDRILEQFSAEERKVIKEYQQLKEGMQNPDISDERFEDILDQIEELESANEEILSYANIRVDEATSDRMEALKYEKKILKRLQKDVADMQKVKEATLRQNYKKDEIKIK